MTARRHRPSTSARSLAMGIVVLVASSLPAGAAQPPFRASLTPPELERYLRWGPIRARPGFDLKDVGYDSNVLNSVDPVGDYRATLAPRLEGLVLFGERAFTEFTAEVLYTGYVQNPDLNYTDYNGKARVTVPFGRVGVFTDVVYDRIRRPPIDLDDIRPIQELSEFGLGGLVEVGWRTTLEYRHSSGRFRNFDDDFGRVGIPIEELLDRTETADRVSAVYEAFGRTELTLDFERTDIAFVRPNIENRPGFDRDAVAWSVLPGIRLSEGRHLTGYLRVGRAQLDHVGDQILDFDGWIGDADIAYRTSSGTRLRASADRSVGFAVSEGNDYYVLDDLRLNAVHYVNRILGIEGEVSRANLEIPGASRTDIILRYRAGIRLRVSENDLGRRVEYAISVGRYDRDSSDDRLDRSRNTFGINVVLGY